MKTKTRQFGNGWSAMLEKLPSGLYLANVRRANGELHDKIRCDDKQSAADYYRAFCAIARTAGA